MANHFRHTGTSRQSNLFTLPLRCLSRMGKYLRRLCRPQQPVGYARGPVCMIKTQQRFWKLKKTLILLVLLCIIATISSVGIYMGGRALTVAGAFDITDIIVRGNHAVTDGQVIKASGLRPGDSIAGIAGSKVGMTVAARLPWIKKATIKRDWPSTLIIHVREYQKFALINLGSAKQRRLFFLNREGEAFAPVGISPDIDYPVISGELNELRITEDKAAVGSPLAEALRFIELAIHGSNFLPVRLISEIQISEDDLILYLVDSPFPIHLGRGGMPGKYSRLVQVLRDLYSNRQIEDIARIRLNYYDNKVLVAKMK